MDTKPLSSLALLLGGALSAQHLDYAPLGPEVVLDTDVTQIQPTVGPPITVTGGVFVFRNVTIHAGVRVRGVGSRPMVWIVTGQFLVNGELSVSGQDGTRADTLHSANVPKPGGIGGAAGGRGGDGSPSAVQRDLRGENGFGPFAQPGVGGAGGYLACTVGTERASGGGGGTFATAGDPGYLTPPGSGTSFKQVLGIGGQGGLGVSGATSRNLLGGRAGLPVFVDGRADNDFFGTAVDVATGRVVVGELAHLIGGQGGGGGGDMSRYYNCALLPQFADDASGGGGGGGGGCVVVFAQGPVVVGPTGRITANGGHGGGGEEVGSCNHGGGGGGGAGGLLILASRTAIGLFTKGETYANRDYDFVLSADGGVGTTGPFGQPVIDGKYPANGQTNPANYGSYYDSAPVGGFGGMGVVQLVAPPGNNSDGTNTHLDDSILLVRNGNLLTGAEKQRFLAWRGFPNAQGVRVDDFNVPIGAIRDGDVRPAPMLMPIF